MTIPPDGLRKILSAFATASGFGSAGALRDPLFVVFFVFEGLVARAVPDDADAERSARACAFDAPDELDDGVDFELSPDEEPGFEAHPLNASPRTTTPSPNAAQRNERRSMGVPSMSLNVVC
jgi:hypothetical protein